MLVYKQTLYVPIALYVYVWMDVGECILYCILGSVLDRVACSYFVVMHPHSVYVKSRGYRERRM